MKLAILSDIHGNLPALEAVLEDLVQWRPDEVVMNGDLVNRGPYSRAALLQLKAALPNCRMLKGNHETFVLGNSARPLDEDDPMADLHRFTRWSAEQLGTELLDEIAGWETSWDRDGLDGRASFHITHGSRLGNRDGIGPHTPDEALAVKLGSPRDLFVASHTHVAMQRRFNGTVVVNTGSVGQPLDGDPRAAYGRFTLDDDGWKPELVRVAYDKQRARDDFVKSGFLEIGGPFAGLIYREHEENARYIGPFMHRYKQAIEAREISLRAAVEVYLATR